MNHLIMQHLDLATPTQEAAAQFLEGLLAHTKTDYELDFAAAMGFTPAQHEDDDPDAVAAASTILPPRRKHRRCPYTGTIVDMIDTPV